MLQTQDEMFFCSFPLSFNSASFCRLFFDSCSQKAQKTCKTLCTTCVLDTEENKILFSRCFYTEETEFTEHMEEEGSKKQMQRKKREKSE